MKPSRPLPPREPRRRRMARLRLRRVPPLSVVPTLLTLGNLLCGFAAIHYAAIPIGPSQVFGWSTLTVAGAVLFLAMFFDALDGTVARLTRSTSDFGAQLDSLADIVSFGVAPAYMMIRLVSHYYGPGTDGATLTLLGPDADNVYAKATWAVAGVYVSCAALRLARYNVETPSPAEEDHRWFRGLPSPGAAGAVASLIVLHQHLLVRVFHDQVPDTFAPAAALVIPAVTLLCAVAMVSRMRYAHAVNRYLRGRRSFMYVVWLAVVVVASLLWLQVTMAVGFTLYALSGPWGALMRTLRPQPAPPAVPEPAAAPGADGVEAAAADAAPGSPRPTSERPASEQPGGARRTP